MNINHKITALLLIKTCISTVSTDMPHKCLFWGTMQLSNVKICEM